MGKYYSDDSEQRKRYFEDQFISLANELAQEQGITLSAFLKDLRNFTTFKKYLEAVFNADPSLANYYEGMSNDEKREFYERSEIQDIVNANLEKEPEEIEKIEAPSFVQQVEKKTRRWFDAKRAGKKTRGYEVTFKVRGKSVTRLRDVKGRFVSRA